ncbi:peptidoglycan editing factor PgeF [Qipengyuania aquimaris]|uniref:peptidoglycan editing factor PgeF n=1 Tax=Qipengyuania aquimaris TaxID=255984 RepID=UPI001CD456F2|nr:peptidoglycan editing factor PgeF [Qipengyuania aquimaris]MCA0903547.1 peptidoglycan editing factor PgeF [Qipengyuania aquimaris]
MAEGQDLLRSDRIEIDHGFLTGPQSDRRELDRIGGDAPTALLKQVHSADCIVVGSGFDFESRPEADAMATKVPQIRLAIVTADCAPVLLHDAGAGVIGAAHAGWRGAHGGVLENTVAAMETLGARPARISAAIGPCISQASYEIDDAFRAKFESAAHRFFEAGREGHWQFDLEGYAARRLSLAGVGEIDRLSLDTYANESRFYSFRRSTHRAEPTEGRQFSAICLTA